MWAADLVGAGAVLAVGVAVEAQAVGGRCGGGVVGRMEVLL